MNTDLFDYQLPADRIAQHSVKPRDHSRLMVVDRATGQWAHKHFFDIVEELQAGDVLVFNDTKVFRARLFGKIGEQEIEVFLLRALEPFVWEVLVKPGKRAPLGSVVTFATGWTGTVTAKKDDGVMTLKCSLNRDAVLAYTQEYGQIPIPPYVSELPDQLDQYQTVYAREVGSVAAPTAGFHFTQRLLDALDQKGVQREFVTLHVGIGTFRPMKTETIEAHQMHQEYVSIQADVAARINQAKQEGRRVIAVGTTTVRTLEGVAMLHSTGDVHAPLQAFTGDVNLFITPGFKFRVINGLITNFHLPKSTLLVLVSAFAGREQVLAAYQEAVKEGYRFFSFGDAMFLR